MALTRPSRTCDDEELHERWCGSSAPSCAKSTLRSRGATTTVTWAILDRPSVFFLIPALSDFPFWHQFLDDKHYAAMALLYSIIDFTSCSHGSPGKPACADSLRFRFNRLPLVILAIMTSPKHRQNIRHSAKRGIFTL